MQNELIYGGWFSESSTATGAPSGFNKAANMLVATAMLVGAGTGAFLDDLRLLQQYRNNDSFIGLSRLPIIEVAPSRSPADDIERIRDVFSPGISTLSDVFGVSRQAVYNWLKGDRPKPEHAAKLRDLAQAADSLANAGIALNGPLLKRKVFEGKNIYEIVRDGGSARDAAQLLVQIVQREQQQRESLNSRFADRKGSSRSVESDFPSENG